MIPLRDSARSRSFPVVNLGLILLTGFVFIRELGLSQVGLTRLYAVYAVNPAKVVWAVGHFASNPTTAVRVLGTLVTAIFLHGGWLHLGGNLLYLWVFGDNVEDRLGHLRYLLLYLTAGVAGFLTHSFLVAPATVPTIGASGAIAGVLGAYIILFPRARVTTLIFLGIFIQILEVPAFVFLIVWFGMQLLSGVASLGQPGTAETVAWWAHVGGFASGLLLGLLLRRRPRPPRAWDRP
ncbi:MAG: rhomboid family intramembrane serine protease [Bacillota bacterium]